MKLNLRTVSKFSISGETRRHIVRYQEQKDSYVRDLQSLRGEVTDFSIPRLKHLLLRENDPLTVSHYEEVLRLKLAISTHDKVLTTLARRNNRMAGVFTESRILTESKVAEQGSGPVDAVATVVQENVADIAGFEHDIAYLGPTSLVEDGQEVRAPLGDFVTRPILVSSLTTLVGAHMDRQHDIWRLFSDEPSVRAKFRNFAYFRGNLKVRITVSGSPFHYGKFLVSYQPYSQDNETLTTLLSVVAATPAARPCLINYLSQARGARVIDVRENQPLEMDIPFICPRPMFSLMTASGLLGENDSYADFSEAGKLFVYSINPIGAVSATPSEVRTTIYVWCEEALLGTLTASQTEIATESGVTDERKSGPVERIASSLTAVTEKLSNIPVIAPFAKASTMVIGGVGKLAALAGWSKPIMLPEHSTFVKNMGFRNGSQLLGTDTNYSLSADPKREITIDPRIAAVDEDEMVLANLAEREAYLTTFVWDPSDDLQAGAIFSCSVTPSSATACDIGVGGIVQPIPAAFAAMPFTYWRCDMVYRIEVVASSFHRGKLLIAFEPNVDGYAITSANTTLNKQYMIFMDIQETQSLEFCVNWASPRPWLLVNNELPYTSTISSMQRDTDGDSNNGFFNIIPYTSLQSPDDSAIEINVYARAKNFHVNYPATTNLEGNRTVVTESMILTESRMTEVSNDTLSNQEITCIELNPSSATTTHISENYFGEEVVSFRALLKRYTYYAVKVMSSVVAAPTLIRFDGPRDIPVTHSWGSSTAMTSLFPHLRYAYLGYRGSMRWRVNPAGLQSDSLFDQVRVKNTPVSSSTLPLTYSTSVLASSSADVAPLEGAIALCLHSNSGIEFETPYYSSNLFNFSFNDDPTVADASLDTYVRNWAATTVVVSDVDGRVMVDCAAGEDFTFLRFTGASPYFIATI